MAPSLFVEAESRVALAVGIAVSFYALELLMRHGETSGISFPSMFISVLGFLPLLALIQSKRLDFKCMREFSPVMTALLSMPIGETRRSLFPPPKGFGPLIRSFYKRHNPRLKEDGTLETTVHQTAVKLTGGIHNLIQVRNPRTIFPSVPQEL